MSDSVSSSVDEDEQVDNQVVQEVHERLEIVEKYDKGCDGQQVDPWENPDFELYKITDRYGFMHNESVQADEDEQRTKMLELKRERKWLKMIQDWHKYEDSIKLRRRLFKGLPDKFRAEIWRRLLELDTNKQANVYEQLKLRARLVSKDLKQIDLDINRTYRNHLFFRRRYDLKQRSLFHVLAAYAMFNTQVGYCQGMSQVAAVLLMYFDEEDAFWALHTLMCDEAHAMHGFFVPGFPKLLRFQQHHDRILKKMLPRLKKHMDKHDIHSALYTTKWFFQCFLDRVPFTLALRLWDIFVMDGDVVLTGMAYNIMKMHQKRLIKLNFEQTMDFLQIQLEQYFGYPNDVVIEHLRASMAELRRSKLLEAPPPASPVEKPSKPFGEILKTPYDELKRSLSVALSRKGRSSRSPSFSSSLPVTPRHRSTSPSKSAPIRSSGVTVTHTLAPIEPPAAGGAVAKQIQMQQQHLQPESYKMNQATAVRLHQDAPSPLTTSSVTTTSGAGSTSTLEPNGDAVTLSPSVHPVNYARPKVYQQQQQRQLARYFSSDLDQDLTVRNQQSPVFTADQHDRDQHSSRTHSASGSGLLKHTESFYDNVPGMEPQSSTREYMEYDSGKNAYGGTTFRTQYTKTSESITTTQRRQHTVNDAYAIRTGPDYVTRIEVGDGQQYSPNAKPARFPVVPDDLNGGLRKTPPPDY